MPTRRRICIVISVALAALASADQRMSAQGALKIVVIQGEGAVNIIQQKTAVAPVIEVRDRNDQPVSGAIVKFAIQKGKASFDGARTLTVTTNPAGRATATGFTPIGSGALKIGATATFQGQTGAATIAQTTVMTTAAGGGLSPLAIAAIAGGSAAGAVLAKNAVASGRTFSGPIDGQIVMNIVTVSAAGSSASCASTRSFRGTVTIQLKEHGDGRVTGRLDSTAVEAEIGSSSCGFGTGNANLSGDIGGTAQNISFANQATSPSNLPLMVTITLAFAGALDNGVISGALTYGKVLSGQNGTGTATGSGTTTIPVTLR